MGLGSSAPMLILLVFMVGFMYFGMIRPQKKQQQQRQQMINDMKKGDAIVTIGGLHGVIDSINRENATVDIDVDGVYLTFDLRAVRVVSSAQTTAAPTETSDASDKSEDETKD